MSKNERGDHIHRRNPSGALDPTAHEALTNVMKETSDSEIRVHRLISAIRAMIELADFELTGRISLRDKRTGRRHT